MSKRLILGALSLCLAGLNPSAEGSVIASDDFESYANGSLINGLNGGTGFTGAYTSDDTSNGVTVATESLSYTNGGLTISGGNQDFQVAQNTNTAGTDNFTANRPFTIQNGTAVYFSFLLRANATATSNNDFFQFGFSLTASSTPSQSFVVSGTSAGAFDFSLRRGASTTVTSSVLFSPSTTYLIVGEIAVTAGSNYNLLNLYVDPGATQPATPTLTDTGGSGVATVGEIDVRTARFGASDVFSLDDLTLGTTYADVVPAPEPATGGLLLVGACLGLCRRSRPRRTA